MQILVLSAKVLDGMGVSLGSHALTPNPSGGKPARGTPTAAGNRDAASTGVARQAAPPRTSPPPSISSLSAPKSDSKAKKDTKEGGEDEEDEAMRPIKSRRRSKTKAVADAKSAGLQTATRKKVSGVERGGGGW